MAKKDVTPGPGHNVDVGYTDLREILDDLESRKEDVSAATGRLRAALKEIIEDREWHKGALAAIRKIHEMPESSRIDFLRTFDALYQCMKAGRWDAEMKDLLSDQEGGE
jgi:hypothetical protein